MTAAIAGPAFWWLGRVTRRSPRATSAELKAIEFGEYLAKRAEQYQSAADVFAATDGERGDELAEAHGALNSAIYEFRKRAMRVVVPT